MVWMIIGYAVTFLVFVAILHFLLYKPVRRIMEERQSEMAADREKAEAMRAEAEKLREEAEERTRALDAKRDELLNTAREEAEERRRELLDEAETQGRERLERFRRVMEHEREQLLEKIRDELRDTIVKVAASALSDAGASLTERAMDRVEELLKQLSDEEKKQATEALDETDGRVRVRSANPLEEETKKRLSEMLAGHLDRKQIELDVSGDPDLLAGMEVTIGAINLEAHWRRIVEEALREQQTTVVGKGGTQDREPAAEPEEGPPPKQEEEAPAKSAEPEQPAERQDQDQAEGQKDEPEQAKSEES